MKKILLLLFIVLFSTLNMFADDISVEQAIQIAAQFAANNTTTSSGIRKAPSMVARPKLAHTIKSNEADKDNVYIVNLGENEGFVVVSGENGTGDEILGYCDHGSFSYNDAPIQLKSLLQSYSASIDMIRQDPSLASQTPNKASAGIGNIVIGPLLTTRWNQHAPYNNMCPEGAVTGCYPTALAQVMNYWKWPEQTIGKVGITDFSGRVFDWNNMLDSYGTNYATFEYSHYNSTQADAVAKLMADIGTAFRTMYNQPNGSPTYFYKEPLYENFNYEPTIETHTGKLASELHTVMKDELNLRRPILYCGGPRGGNGDPHALVCDGYTSNDYFHFNYGWGGNCDGYYKNAIVFRFPADCIIFTGVRPYDGKNEVIGNITYGLLNDGTAEILKYNKKETNAYLVIPNTVSDDNGNTYKVTKIKGKAFMGSGHFIKLTFGENIESIDRYSFANSKIDTLILNDKIKNIPEAAFMNTNIKTLDIGASVNRIEKQAFLMCPLSSVTSKSSGIDIVGENVFVNCSFNDTEWFDCITSIADGSFYGVTFNKLPKFSNLVSVGSKAFYGAKFAKGLTNWPEFNISAKLKYIAPDAFEMSNLAKFTVDENNPYFSSPSWPLLFNKNETSLVSTALKWQSKLGSMTLFPTTMIKMESKSIKSKSDFAEAFCGCLSL